MVLGLCERFHKLPSEIYEEESDFWELLKYEEMGRQE